MTENQLAEDLFHGYAKSKNWKLEGIIHPVLSYIG
jgi:hypothetical protein